MLVQLTAYAKDIRVFLNNREIEFDQPPVLYNDTTMVPIRAIFEAIGMTVQWDGENQRATAFNDDYNITFIMGRDYIFKDGTGTPIETGPIIINSRMLVPVRAIMEAIDGEVMWDGENQFVIIDVKEAVDSSQWPKEVLRLTNEIRREYGLGELVWNDKLASAAREHCMDMSARGYFDHNTPEGKTPFDRLKEKDIDYYVAAENIATGQTSPQAVVDAWMNSQGHRENILNPDVTELGVGMCRDGDYGIYWAQEFILPR